MLQSLFFSSSSLLLKPYFCQALCPFCVRVLKSSEMDTDWHFFHPPTHSLFSVCLFFFLSVFLFVCLSFCLFFFLSVFHFVCFSFCLFFVLSVFRFVCFLFVCFSFCWFFVLSVFLLVCFSFCLLFFMSVFLFVKKGRIGSRKFWPEGEILGIFSIEVAP